MSKSDLPVEPRRSGRIDFIDGLRGLAMLAVLLHHQWIFARFPKLQVGGMELQNPLIFGYLGVHLFLVVSGFCLAWPYSEPGRRALEGLTLFTFIRRRFIRLAPAYYVALVLSAFIVFARAFSTSGAIPTSYWWDLGAHFLWLHNLNSDYLGSFNNALWSLGLEFQLYLIFPLFLLLKERFGVLILAGVVVGLQMTYRSLTHDVVLGQEEYWAGAYSIAYSVPGRMFEFVAGIIVAGMVRKLPPQGVSVMYRWGLLALWVSSCASATYLVLKYGTFYPAADVLWAVFFASTILLCFVSNRWRMALESGMLVRCGIISYSVYLIHFPIGLWLEYNVYFVDSFPVTLRMAAMCLYPLCAILVGYAFYRWFEKPFLKKR